MKSVGRIKCRLYEESARSLEKGSTTSKNHDEEETKRYRRLLKAHNLPERATLELGGDENLPDPLLLKASSLVPAIE